MKKKPTIRPAESPKEKLKAAINPGELYLSKTIERLARHVGFESDQARHQLSLLIEEGYLVESHGIGIDGSVKCWKRPAPDPK